MRCHKWLYSPERLPVPGLRQDHHRDRHNTQRKCSEPQSHSPDHRNRALPCHRQQRTDTPCDAAIPLHRKRNAILERCETTQNYPRSAFAPALDVRASLRRKASLEHAPPYAPPLRISVLHAFQNTQSYADHRAALLQLGSAPLDSHAGTAPTPGQWQDRASTPVQRHRA